MVLMSAASALRPSCPWIAATSFDGSRRKNVAHSCAQVTEVTRGPITNFHQNFQIDRRCGRSNECRIETMSPVLAFPVLNGYRCAVVSVEGKFSKLPLLNDWEKPRDESPQQ